MAKVTITEHTIGSVACGMQVAKWPAIAKQVVNVTGAHQESAPFNEATKMIRFATDIDCAFDIGPAVSVAATINDDPLFAKQREYAGVEAGYAISVIAI